MTPLLYVYMFLVVYRPHEIWPELAEWRLEFYFSLLLLVVWLFHPQRRVTFDRLTACLGLFGACLMASWLSSPWTEPSFGVVYKWLPNLLFFVVVTSAGLDLAQLRKLLIAFLVVFALYMTHSLVEYGNGRVMHRMGIPRLMGVDETYGDPNTFAASIVYALVFLRPLWAAPSGTLLRGFLVGFLALGLVCILLTGSRAALVALAALYGLTFLTSRHKLALGALGILLCGAAVLTVSDAYYERWWSIFDPDSGPASAHASAEGRWLGLTQGLVVWGEHFLLGAGPGCWRLATGLHLESHNLYGQLCAEMGLLGIIAFAALLGSWWTSLRALRRRSQEESWDDQAPFAVELVRALGFLLILLLLGGLFGHNLYRYTWVWALGFLGVLRANTAPDPVEALAEQESLTDDAEEPTWDWGVVAIQSRAAR